MDPITLAVLAVVVLGGGAGIYLLAHHGAAASASPSGPTPDPTQPITPPVPQPSSQGGQPPQPVSPAQPVVAAGPPSGPFDLSHATTHLAWQNDSTFIAAYQGALKFLAWKQNQPSWDPGIVGGKFNPATKSAVTAFQVAHGITPTDGEVGTTTAHGIVAAMQQTQTGATGSGERFIDLDQALTPEQCNAIISQIVSQIDPAKLDAAAAQYSAYPWARYELRLRAWELRGGRGAAPTKPGTAPAHVPAATTTGAHTPAAASSMAAQAIGVAIAAGRAAGHHTGAQQPYSAFRGNDGMLAVTDTKMREEVQGMPPVASRQEGVGSATLPVTASDMEVGSTTLPVTASDMEVGALPGRFDHPRGSERELSGALPGRYDHPRGSERELTGAAPESIAAAAAHAAQFRPVVPATAPGQRPLGGWYLRIRPTDKPFPRTIAAIGTGAPRGGSTTALAHLVDINPHLAPGGVLRQIVAGDEVNIPGTWANNLTARGFDVHVDRENVGEMG